MRLITANELQGQLARWAVMQHPYKRPPGLLDVVALLGQKADADFSDGDPRLPMRWFSSQGELEQWVEYAIGQHPAVQEWSQPTSGHKAPFVFVSRYNAPEPEDDFIDLWALLRNIARGAWDASAEFEKAA